jgi:hypothetical protein
MPTAPIRTDAGEDELRCRTRKLGQRYRTVLLLIDGKRSVDELLTLAQQAGAAVSHFEELVQLGLVEVPVTETAVEPAAQEDAAVAAATPAGEPPRPDAPSPESHAADVATAPAPATALLPPIEPGVPTGATPAAPDETPEERLLQQVRDLLIDTLRIDSPLFGARTFFRVRSAQSSNELIELVWEIENHLAGARHTRDELISLHRARELLGMGNTRVAGETNPGKLAE